MHDFIREISSTYISCRSLWAAGVTFHHANCTLDRYKKIRTEQIKKIKNVDTNTEGNVSKSFQTKLSKYKEKAQEN